MRYLTIIFLLSFSILHAQRYTLSESEISFFSEAPLENIEAFNTKSSGLLDLSSKKVAVAVPIQSFEFELSLMQEHFNEKYMESDKYPRAFFQGELSDFNPEAAEQSVTVTGKLSIHGIEKPYELKGTILREGKAYRMKGEFMVALDDHKIKVPKLMWQNIAEEILVRVNLVFNEKN